MEVSWSAARKSIRARLWLAGGNAHQANHGGPGGALADKAVASIMQVAPHVCDSYLSAIVQREGGEWTGFPLEDSKASDPWYRDLRPTTSGV